MGEMRARADHATQILLKRQKLRSPPKSEPYHSSSREGGRAAAGAATAAEAHAEPRRGTTAAATVQSGTCSAGAAGTIAIAYAGWLMDMDSKSARDT